MTFFSLASIFILFAAHDGQRKAMDMQDGEDPKGPKARLIAEVTQILESYAQTPAVIKAIVTVIDREYELRGLGHDTKLPGMRLGGNQEENAD